MDARRRDHNLRRIQSNTSDTDGSLKRGNEEVTRSQFSYSFFTAPSVRIVATELIPICMVVMIPFSVHAGVFSSIFNSPEQISSPVTEVVYPQHPSEVKLLSSLTNVDPKAALGGGDVLVDEGALINSGPFGADAYSKQSLSAGEISVYVVREGDSLSQIADMFDVTTNTILWANDIAKATSIRPGDSLIILPIVGVRHVIKEGDTLSTIAKKYEGDTEEILSFNQMTSASELVVGETIIVPGGNMHVAAPKKTASKPSASNSSSASSGGSSSGGAYTHPLPGAVRTQGIHGYNAVDLAAPVGTPIRAAAAGEVIVSRSSGWNGGYGTYMVIKHPKGSQTLYSHMSSVNYVVGDYVEAGATIGYVGMTGKSTGAHLHFEVRGASNPF